MGDFPAVDMSNAGCSNERSHLSVYCVFQCAGRSPSSMLCWAKPSLSAEGGIGCLGEFVRMANRGRRLRIFSAILCRVSSRRSGVGPGGVVN